MISGRTTFLAACSALLAIGCAGAAPKDASPWSGATQLVLVTTAGWDATQGTLRRFERTDAAWRQVGPGTSVTIGRAGSAWGMGLHPAQEGTQKREGDGRAPAGVFRIGTAFGYAADASTGLQYQGMDADDYCMDVPASPHYNRIVDRSEVGEDAVAGSTEPMRLDLHGKGDQRYRLGFVIEHNAAQVPGGGSCIFAHLWKAPGETTAGCTAMTDDAMRELLAWLHGDRNPIFVLLPQAEHARLRTAWSLPALPAR